MIEKDTLLEPLSLKDLQNDQPVRARSNSLASISTISTNGVSIRNGRVRLEKAKKSIPTWQLYLLICCLISFSLLGVWYYFGTMEREVGNPFTRLLGVEEEDDDHYRTQKVTGTRTDFATFCVASILIAVAAGGGIGGGGVLVPTYIFVLQFPTKYAVPLSNCTILGSSISNLILNINKKHPLADRPLIDWDIMLMMEPLTIAGALVGTYIHHVSPPWLISILLDILLTLTAIRTLKKGVKKYRQESAEFAAEAEEEARENAARNPKGYSPLTNDLSGVEPIQLDKLAGIEKENVLQWNTTDVKKWWQTCLPPGCQDYVHIVDECELDGADLLDLDYESLTQFDVKKMLIMKILRRINQLKASMIKNNPNFSTGADVPVKRKKRKFLEAGEPDPRMVKAKKENNTALIEILEMEQSHHLGKALTMFFVTAFMLVVTILKGGSGGSINPLNVDCGTGIYWVIVLSIFPMVFTVCYLARNYLVALYYAKEEAGYEYLEADIEWNERHTIIYPAICSIAGLCAGLFGIGGGIVKGPLMLEMGVYPAVTSATSATMILFTSAGASCSYLLFQQLNLNYAAVLFCLGIVWTLVGQKVLFGLVKKYKRNSLIIFVIGAVVAASAVAMGVHSSKHLLMLFNGESDPAESLCSGNGGGE